MSGAVRRSLVGAMVVALLAGGADAASGSTGGVPADSAVEARGAERTLTDVSTRVPSTQDRVPLGAALALAPTDYTIEEFYDDFDGARLLLDQWWAAHWNDHFTGTYTSPGVITGGRVRGRALRRARRVGLLRVDAAGRGQRLLLRPGRRPAG